MRGTKKQRYFVEIPHYKHGTAAKIHKAEIVSRYRNAKDPRLDVFKIKIENEGEYPVDPSRVYNSYQAALAAKKEYDKQEIERCKRFIAELEKSTNPIISL